MVRRVLPMLAALGLVLVAHHKESHVDLLPPALRSGRTTPTRPRYRRSRRWTRGRPAGAARPRGGPYLQLVLN